MNTTIALPPLRTNTLVRPLGTMEHFWWLMEHSCMFHFSVAAEVSGSTSIDDWRKALDAVQQRHPLLSVCIHRGQNGASEFHSGHKSPIPLHVIEGGDLNVWEIEMAREMGTKFDSAKAPLIRATLIHRHYASVIILTVHHSIADAMSSVYLIRDLLQALSGNALSAIPFSESQDVWVERTKMALGEFPSLPASADDTPQVKGSLYRVEDGTDPTVQHLQLPFELTMRLRERARLEKTTVHGALCAALALAGRRCSEEWNNRPVRICSPINARPMLGIEEDCGLYTSAVIVPCNPDPSDSFWDLARTAKLGLKPAVSTEGVLQMISTLQNVVPRLSPKEAAELGAVAFGREAAISNLGVLPIGTEFGDLTLDAVWGPSVLQGLEGDQVLGVTTLREGAICLLYSSYSPFPNLLQLIQATLASACL